MLRFTSSLPARPVLTIALLLTGLPFAQSQTPASPSLISRDAASQTADIHVSTQLVVIDITAEDKNGNPIHNLSASDFILTEDKTPQPLRNFEAHSGVPPMTKTLPVPPLPPGTFTDYAPVPASPSSVLNVILVDTMNTPFKDQPYLQAQLLEYIRTAKPGVPTAIFGLANHLILLQGFSSDPEVLRAAIASKRFQHPSNLLADTSGLNANLTSIAPNQGDMITTSGPSTGPPNVAATEAALAQFMTVSNTSQLQSRIQASLDAFNQLGHYLATLPGRKNVIWFSGAFPITLVPSAQLQQEDIIPVEEQTQFHETINLLTRARVSVYPIDARGLQTSTVFDMAYGSDGLKSVGSAASFASDNETFANNLAAEHETMRKIAADTGGKAFINTNNLTKAADLALNAGNDFYSLAYSPSNHAQNGKFRSIHIALTDAAKAKGVTLSYRKGYYAPDAANPHQTVDTATASDRDMHSSFARISMNFGAPTPSDIVFTTRVLPASTTVEDQPARDNILDPKTPIKPPFRRYDVDIAAFPKDVQLLQQPNGNRVGRLHFVVFLYSPEGKLINTAGRYLTYNLTPDQYTHFLQTPINVHMEVSAPASQESFFRIGLQDVVSHHIGVVQVAASSIAKLPPPDYAAATSPAAKPLTAQP